MTDTTDTKELKSRVPRPAWRVLAAILTTLSLWLVLSAPRLERAAEASPEGARRTAALVVLRPIAWLSESSGLARAVGNLERAVGKDPDEQPGGELDLDAALGGFEVPPPTQTPEATPPVEPDRPGGKQRDARKHEERIRDIDLRSPTTKVRLRVAVIGDSYADGIGDALGRAFRPSLVHILNLGRIATGLARADYFDWVAGMEKVTRRYRPDLVVVMLGGNDKQSVVFPGGRAVLSGDPDWGQAYRGRIEDLLEAAGDSHVVWLGLPPVRDKGKSRLFHVYNDMYRDVTEERKNSAYIDIWDDFAGKDGSYRAYGEGSGGDTVLLRAGDGAHFTAAGYDLVVDRIVAILKRWQLPTKTLR